MDGTELILKELSEATGLPGFEREVRDVIRRHCEAYASIEYDRLGSIICRKEGTARAPRVMLAGHMDEVGFITTFVTEKGLLRFQALGGWFDQVLLAQRVIVKTGRGDIPGIIGAKPPHLMIEEDRKKVVQIKDMFIDIGASSGEEAENLGVRPGDPIVPDSKFAVMANGKVLMGKAWDNRVGCALFMEVIRRLSSLQHPNTVYGVGTVQEEVGLRGATTSAHVVDPDVGFALEVDVSGGTPGIEEHEAPSRLGKGPAVSVYDGSMVPNARLRDMVFSVAKEASIPIQASYMARGGTDAGKIHLNKSGVPSLVIGVPSRYIHSHVGIINRDDFEAAAALVTAVVTRLDAATVADLTA